MRAARWGIELLASSWRYDIEGGEQLRLLRAARTRMVYAVWHGALLPGLWRHRDQATTLLISRHADGGKLAAAAQAWGYRVIRGSTTRGGARGLLGLVRTLQTGGAVAVTPDGPRGPARVVKPGVVAAAQCTGAAIVPVGIASSSAWRTKSWDRFLIPRPFARIRMVYGKPLVVAAGSAALAEGVRRLQESLAEAMDRAECDQ